MRNHGDNRTSIQILHALRQLNPGRTAREAASPFVLTLVCSSEESAAGMKSFLLGISPDLRSLDRAESVLQIHTPSDSLPALESDFILAEPGRCSGMRIPSDKRFTFDPNDPEGSLMALIESPRGRELALSIACHLPAFRPYVTKRTVREVSRENTVFVIATALGHVVPNVFQPIISLAEAAGDIVFLTSNQVRMLFAIGAAHGERIGYAAQWREVASIIGAGFGWRMIARNLVSKIPFGGGLAPKGVVAYVGTTVIGEGLRFYYTTGRRMTRDEMRQATRRVYADARDTVRSMPSRLRPRRALSRVNEA